MNNFEACLTGNLSKNGAVSCGQTSVEGADVQIVNREVSVILVS